MDSVARRWFAILVLGSAGFTLFGSLVPFEFRSKTWSDAVDSFVWAMTNRLAIESRSDGVANVMLGVPLGFALLGMLCADRGTSRYRASLYGLAMLPACCAFAASVEFAQLYVPVRTCAGSDVLAQTLGSAIGMVGWLVCGQWLTNEIRKATTGTGAAGRFLIGYVLLLGFIQALPLDLTLSPANAYRKFRDGKVRFIPFGEFRTYSRERAWERAADLLKLAGLYLPAGLLAGCLPGRFWSSENAGQVLLAAIALPVGIEAGQVLVESRVSSATDALIGAFAVAGGWRLAQGYLWGNGTWRLFGSAWFGLLAVISWQPFGFPGPAQRFDWVPGMPLESGNPLSALEEMLTKLVLFGLGGVIVAGKSVAYASGSSGKTVAYASGSSGNVAYASGSSGNVAYASGSSGNVAYASGSSGNVAYASGSPGWALAIAAVVGLLTSMVFEVGQMWTPNHSPSITDVLLGGLGAFTGAWIVGRVLYCLPSPQPLSPRERGWGEGECLKNLRGE